ncbi:NAD(P)-binding domain-containing protein [Candidatus Roizmanbacteria bacterium]|nr:NAD(P)-binding domain-containing protein [Candidatus Roizmanbacteria bacterium]
MKIAFFEIDEWEKEYLKEKLAEHELSFFDTPLTKENIDDVKDVEIISIFLSSSITRDIIDKLPNLRLISTRSTGYDHIDVSCRKYKNVVVCNVPHYGTHTVAEHTFALILALSRKIFESIERTKHSEFDHSQLTGFDLYDKTIGVIGMGDIGEAVIKIAKGFGMHVVVFSRHPDEKVARRLGVSFLNLNELLVVSDVVTLHVPYTKETHHMINKKNIKKFKQGSLLINTARGGLIQTEAIVYGLEKGILRGAGLDVLEGENIIAEERQLLTKHYMKTSNIKTLFLDHVLMDKENVVVTPHNAFNSTEALYKILDVTVDNILDFIKQKPQNMIGE